MRLANQDLDLSLMEGITEILVLLCNIVFHKKYILH